MEKSGVHYFPDFFSRKIEDNHVSRSIGDGDGPKKEEKQEEEGGGGDQEGIKLMVAGTWMEKLAKIG